MSQIVSKPIVCTQKITKKHTPTRSRAPYIHKPEILVCMWIYIHVYTYTGQYVYIYIHTYIHTCIYIHIHTIYTYTFIFIIIGTHLYTYIICIYIYIYAYTHACGLLAGPKGQSDLVLGPQKFLQGYGALKSDAILGKS